MKIKEIKERGVRNPSAKSRPSPRIRRCGPAAWNKHLVGLKKEVEYMEDARNN